MNKYQFKRICETHDDKEKWFKDMGLSTRPVEHRQRGKLIEAIKEHNIFGIARTNSLRPNERSAG